MAKSEFLVLVFDYNVRCTTDFEIEVHAHRWVREPNGDLNMSQIEPFDSVRFHVGSEEADYLLALCGWKTLELGANKWLTGGELLKPDCPVVLQAWIRALVNH